MILAGSLLREQSRMFREVAPGVRFQGSSAHAKLFDIAPDQLLGFPQVNLGAINYHSYTDAIDQRDKRACLKPKVHIRPQNAFSSQFLEFPDNEIAEIGITMAVFCH